jgi:hypothetical protein
MFPKFFWAISDFATRQEITLRLDEVGGLRLLAC